MDSRQMGGDAFQLIGKDNYFFPMMGFHLVAVMIVYPE